MLKRSLLKVTMAAGVLAVMLTACGSDTKDTKSSGEETVSTKAASDAADEENEKTQDDSSDSKTEGKDDGQAASENMNVAELAQAIADSRSEVSFALMTDSYLEGVMSIDVSKVDEYAVYVDASGTSVDEFGIFKANDGEAEDVKKMIQDYLDMRLDTWMDEYMPEEKPKVEKAKLESNGDYFIYTILGDNEAEEAIKTFKNAVGE